MARIRSIKPSIWTDPRFVACSPLARLLWIGTWNFADDYGVLKDDPAELRLQILPADDCDPYALVDELVKREMLVRKVAPDGTPVLVIRTFCVHQKIDTRSPGRWGIPTDFEDPDECTHADQRKCTRPDKSPPIPTDPDLGGEGTGPTFLVNPGGSTDPFGDSFAECWSLYPRKVGRKEALRAYQARRRSGVSHEQLLTATRNYAKAMVGVEPRFVMHGKRFYGPNENWCEYVDWKEADLLNPPESAEVVER